MSAYGPSPSRPSDLPILPTQIIELRPTRNVTASTGTPEDSEKDYHLAVYHLTAQTIPSELATYLYETFQDELEKGVTYPQEYPMARSGFDVYFLGNDVFVGVLVGNTITANCDIEQAQNGREWNACIGGTYYVKPNYPDRSSHICNAGFLVPPKLRGLGIATALGQSYVVNAPLLGYKASVFNLVYVNNVASVRIWERLGFLRVGRIPFAGRLRRKEEQIEAGGSDEEYVDAWVIYKSFVEDSVYTITGMPCDAQ